MINSDIYRVRKCCSNCPFLDDGKAMRLADGRVDDIKDILLEGEYESFNCHKTVYDLDENMENSAPQKLKMCYGAYKVLKDKDRPNMQMRFAKHLKIEEM